MDETYDILQDVKLARGILRGLSGFGHGMTDADRVSFIAYRLNKVRSMAYSDGFRDGIKQSDAGDKK